MNYLFFFVHPSKYHLFKNTINQLLLDGHSVKVLITKKDVLEELVKQSGWDYENIFPEGRKIKNIPVKLGAAINAVRTLYRLNKHVSNKKYDLFVTDDLLTIIGRMKNIPAILFQDDDLAAVPESFILLGSANFILAPDCTDFSRFNKKKISFKGFKASAYLHPNSFTPDKSILKKYDLDEGKYFIIRLVYLASTHDTGKKGLTDDEILSIIKKLTKHGKVIISSEREVSKSISEYRKDIQPQDLVHLLNYCELLISDSQTMSMEAAFLGTPFIRFNEFVGRISYLDVLENKYELGYGILAKDKEKLFSKIEELITNEDLRNIWKKKRENMLNETINLSKYMVWLFENYFELTKEHKWQLEQRMV